VRAFLGATLALAAVGWPFGELMGSFPWPMLGGGIGVALFTGWRAWRDREQWPEQRAVDRALRRHVDPGPEYRSAAEQAARVQLARPGGGLIAGIVIVGVVVAACVLTALERDDPTVALSAVPLVAAFVWGGLVTRRQDGWAARWLTYPPYPHEQEQGP
jgi:hypothetical protein